MWYRTLVDDISLPKGFIAITRKAILVTNLLSIADARETGHNFDSSNIV